MQVFISNNGQISTEKQLDSKITADLLFFQRPQKFYGYNDEIAAYNENGCSVEHLQAIDINVANREAQRPAHVDCNISYFDNWQEI